MIVILPLKSPNLMNHRMMCECFSENFKRVAKEERKKKELHSFQFKWLRRRDELIKTKPGLKWKGKIL